MCMGKVSVRSVMKMANFIKATRMPGKEKHSCPCQSMREIENFTFTLLKESRPNLTKKEYKEIADKLITQARDEIVKAKADTKIGKIPYKKFLPKISSSSLNQDAHKFVNKPVYPKQSTSEREYFSGNAVPSKEKSSSTLKYKPSTSSESLLPNQYVTNKLNCSVSSRSSCVKQTVSRKNLSAEVKTTSSSNFACTIQFATKIKSTGEIYSKTETPQPLSKATPRANLAREYFLKPSSHSLSKEFETEKTSLSEYESIITFATSTPKDSHTRKLIDTNIEKPDGSSIVENSVLPKVKTSKLTKRRCKLPNRNVLSRLAGIGTDSDKIRIRRELQNLHEDVRKLSDSINILFKRL